MYLLQMKYFVTICQYQHVTQAAKTLQISQSTLSTMLNKLEEELGVPLFDRQGRHIVLNQYGQTLYYHCQIILHEIEDIQQELAELQNQELPYTVTVGVSDSTLHGDWLFDIFEKKPDLKLQILQMSRWEIHEKLLTQELDFGISFALELDPRIASSLLIDQPYLLLVADNHPLAANSEIPARELANQGFISLPPSNLDRHIDLLSTELHFKPRIIFEGHTEMMQEMMRMGTGVILTSEHNLHLWCDPQDDTSRTVSIADLPCHYQIFLSWKQDRYLPLQAQILKHYIEQFYQVETDKE